MLTAVLLLTGTITVLAFAVYCDRHPLPETPVRKYPFPAYVEPPADAPISPAERIARREIAARRESFYDMWGYDYVERLRAAQEEVDKAKIEWAEFIVYNEASCLTSKQISDLITTGSYAPSTPEESEAFQRDYLAAWDILLKHNRL